MISRLKKLMAGLSRGHPVETESLDTTDSAIAAPVGPIDTQIELGDKETSREQGWIGVDLDGTLAYFEGWQGFDHIGKPVPAIKARVIEWIAQGYRVKIFTARASVPEGIEPIRQWLVENGMPELEITASKDFHLIEIWDDRAIQIVRNTGSPVLSSRWAAQPRAPLFGLSRDEPKREADSGNTTVSGAEEQPE